jgi:hypothetical protein
MNKAAVATVNTQPRREQNTIDPRATRYGVLPIWPISTSARDFYVWELPANILFPFRPFIGEVGQDVNGRETYRTERLPKDQIVDLYTMSKFFIELPELAELKDEARVQRIAEVLSSPKACDKYPLELATSCVTCWTKYLFTDAPENVLAAFDGEPDLQEAAARTIQRLREGFAVAIEEARRNVDVAVRNIDDPKSGKSMFYAWDYLNIYHTHADRPQYRTSTANQNVGTQLAEALANLSGQRSDPADLAKMIADAVAKETAALREELAKVQALTPAVDAEPAKLDAETVERKIAEKTAKVK